jgi:hypothetical protein
VRALGVKSKQGPLVLRIDDFVNRPDRTRGDTRAAVDADIRIDVVALAVRMEALDRAMLDTVCKEAKAAVVRDDVRHSLLPIGLLGVRATAAGR